jgi:2-polyprenyl-3-methyl-5-hydroxy-6-metoxy-1,4-benzoquinol methylase
MDNKFIEKFYNETLEENIKQRGFFGFLFHKLRRFETHRFEIVLNFAGLNNKFESILDIGCDKGFLLEKISKKNECKNIFGVDLNKDAIFQCQKKFQFAENFSIQNIDEKLNFPNDSFDLVTMVAVLEHVFDPFEAINEIFRILKPGGMYIVEVPNIAFIKYRINLFFGIRPRTSWGYGWDGGHLNYFTASDLKKLLELKGFKIIVAGGSGIFYYLRKWWPSLLFPNIIIKAQKNT